MFSTVRCKDSILQMHVYECELLIYFDLHLIINMFVLLLTILISPLLSQTPAYSSVASEYFGSYQATFPFGGGGSSITAGTSSYLIIFKEVRANVSIGSTFVIFGGLQRSGSGDQSGFKVQVATAISTQAMLALTVNGTSVFQSLIFIVLVVSGPANNGYFEAAYFQRNQTITSTGPSTKVNNKLPNITQTTSVPNFNYKVFLSHFSLIQTNNGGGSLNFNVGIDINSITSNSVTFSYYVDQKTTINQIGIVIIFYRPTGNNYITIPTQTYQLDYYYSDYATNLGNLPSSNFSDGYQDKCIIGHTKFIFDRNYNLKFELKSTSSPYGYSNPTPPINNIHTLCLIKLYDCRKIHPNCTNCNSYSKCTSCDPTYYPVNFNFPTKCQLCSLTIVGCNLCTNATICINCTYPTYVMDSSSICQPCNVYKPFCLNCNKTASSPTITITCQLCMNYYGLDTNNNCSLCSSMMTGCQLCNNSITCAKCFNGYYLNAGTCILCSTAINNCAICDNATYCTLCNSDSYLSNNNSNCTCNPGLYPISGFCSVPGCSSAIRFTSSTSCLACSTSTSFYLAGTDCDCMVGYTLGGNSCIVTCGDSRVINESCDDGNVISGDGCSSTCQVQTNYNCSGGNFSVPSICRYIGPLTVSLANIVKSSGLNQATLTFTISPATFALNSMDFSKFVNLTVGNQNITKTIYYYQSGTLSIVVDYSTSLQGLSTQMNLSYERSKVDLDPVKLNFKMVGSNLPVVIADISGHQNIVYSLGFVLAGIFIFCLLLSTIFHKMIGLQTMQILQIIFFLRYLLTNTNPLVFFNINSIKYINGYNFFSQYTNIRMLDGNLLRMGLGKSFVFNVMIQVAIIIIMALFSYWFIRKIRHLKIRKADQTSVGMDELKKAQLYERKFTTAGFIFTVYSFYIVIFSTLSSLQSQEQLSVSLPRLLFIFTMFVLIYSILFITGHMYLSWKPKYDENEGLSHKYISFFLGYHMLISLLIIALPGLPYGKCIIAAFQFIYILILIVIKPYFLNVQNVLLIICEIIGFMFNIWLIVSDFVYISNATLHKIMVAYESLLAVVGVIAIVRIYLHFKDNDKAFKLMHQEEDRMKGKDSFSKTEFQKQQVFMGNQKAKPTLSQKKRIEETQQIEELQRIKNRLKGQHRLKLMQETIL